MRFDCGKLGFHFDMNNEDFIALNEKGKRELMGMNEQQLAQNLFTFAEAKDGKFTGRWFSITLDGGRYPTEEAVKEGLNLCVDNVKKYTPLKMESDNTIMPGNIRHCVWRKPDDKLFVQLFMAKNGYMFCVAGEVSAAYDELDMLMSSLCMSVKSDSKEDLAKEQQENLMNAIAAEANRLADAGMNIDEAMNKAMEKYGVKQK